MATKDTRKRRRQWSATSGGWGRIGDDSSEPILSHEGVDLRGFIVRHDTRFEEDSQCRLLVAMHPRGMTLDEVAVVLEPSPRGEKMRARSAPGRLGISREAVRLIEAQAVAKIRKLPAHERDAFVDALRHRDARAPSWWETLAEEPDVVPLQAPRLSKTHWARKGLGSAAEGQGA